MGERNKGHDIEVHTVGKMEMTGRSFGLHAQGAARRTQDAGRKTQPTHKTRKMISILDDGVAWTHIC